MYVRFMLFICAQFMSSAGSNATVGRPIIREGFSHIREGQPHVSERPWDVCEHSQVVCAMFSLVYEYFI